jgi:hypothetical protein
MYWTAKRMSAWGLADDVDAEANRRKRQADVLDDD